MGIAQRAKRLFKTNNVGLVSVKITYHQLLGISKQWDKLPLLSDWVIDTKATHENSNRGSLTRSIEVDVNPSPE